MVGTEFGALLLWPPQMRPCGPLCVRLRASRPPLPPWRAALLLTLLCLVTASSRLLFHLQQARRATSPGQVAADTVSWIDIPPSARPRKTVLLLTPLQGSFTNWRRRFGESFDGCRWSRCELTAEPAALATADAVLVSLYDLRPAERLPEARPGQLWLLYEREAPPALRRRHPYLMDPAAASRFHWTLSYHSDADIPVPYGVILPRHEAPPPAANRSRAARPGRDPRSGRLETAEQRAARQAAEEERLLRQWRRTVGERVAPVVWVSSHCHTDSLRETYVGQLRQHIDVDVYGECGNLSCPLRKKSFCMRLFAQHYTFMLAFENALCDDYVTEKFFNALQHGLIPVVLGGANYSRLAPADSFVDAQQFSSPAALAAHLLRLSRQPAELARLRDWQRHYRVYSGEREFTWWKCELCRRLHGRRARVQRRDLYRALAGAEQCHGSWQEALAARYGPPPGLADPD